MSAIKLVGNVDENLCSSADGKIKTVRLINVVNENINYSFEIVSEDNSEDHLLLNSLLGKNIEITVTVVE